MSLINVTNLTFAYEGSYDNTFENVSFQIDTDWKFIEIKKLLIEREPTILFVEHDSVFCENVATKIIKL